MSSAIAAISVVVHPSNLSKNDICPLPLCRAWAQAALLGSQLQAYQVVCFASPLSHQFAAPARHGADSLAGSCRQTDLRPTQRLACCLAAGHGPGSIVRWQPAAAGLPQPRLPPAPASLSGAPRPARQAPAGALPGAAGTAAHCSASPHALVRLAVSILPAQNSPCAAYIR